MLKKVSVFIGFFLPWFLASAVPVDYNYYSSINLPSFAPPKLFFIIAWAIVYTFIALSSSSILNNYKWNEVTKSYKVTLLINYLFNQAYTLIFFGLKNNFLAFVDTVGTFISCLFLCLETSNLKEKSTRLLIPYVLLSSFIVILAFSIFILNN